MCWAGQGGSNAAPSPRTPLPRSATKILTHADHFGMIRTAQRRFAPTVIGITRNSDRHQIGMRDRHRRNTHFPWALELNGSINYGNPYDLRFQGRGIVKGEEWVYDYEGYVIRPWPNGVDQRPAFVGTVVRTVAHSQGKSKAGVVASFIAVRQDDKS